MYARVIYGTQSSVIVGLFTTIGVVIIGGTVGALAGYYGGWVDAVLARINDIFFALPLILGAIVLTQLPFFRANRNVWSLVVDPGDLRLAADRPHHPRRRRRSPERRLRHRGPFAGRVPVPVARCGT